MAALALVLFCLPGAPARAAATADLAGQWSGFIQYMNQTPGTYGQSSGYYSVGLLLNIDASGQVSGLFNNHQAGGGLSVSGLGALTGSVIDNHVDADTTWTLTDGRLNASGDLLAGVVSRADAPTICGRLALMRVGLAGASSDDLIGAWGGYILDAMGSLGDESYLLGAIGRYDFTVELAASDVSGGTYAYLTAADIPRHGTVTGPVPVVTDGFGFLGGSLTCTLEGGSADSPLVLTGARLNQARDGIIGCLDYRSGWIAFSPSGAATPPELLAGWWRVYSFETTGINFHRPVVADLLLVPSDAPGELRVARGGYRYPATGDTGAIVSGSLAVSQGTVTGGTYTTDGHVDATINAGTLNRALDAGAMILSNDVSPVSLCNHSVMIRLANVSPVAATGLMLLD